MSKLKRLSRSPLTRVNLYADYSLLVALGIFITIGSIQIVSASGGDSEFFSDASDSIPSDITTIEPTGEDIAEPDWELRLSDWKDYYLPKFQQQHTIGKRVNVKLARGNTVPGTLMEVKPDAVVIGMERGQATIKRLQIHSNMRGDFFAEDYALSEAKRKIRSERLKLRAITLQAIEEDSPLEEEAARLDDEIVKDENSLTEKLREQIASVSSYDWLLRAALWVLGLPGVCPLSFYTGESSRFAADQNSFHPSSENLRPRHYEARSGRVTSSR
jgi:hypothetical protein